MWIHQGYNSYFYLDLKKDFLLIYNYVEKSL